MVNDRIADSIFNSSNAPDEYSILADELEWGLFVDAAAAIVGGLGMGPAQYWR